MKLFKDLDDNQLLVTIWSMIITGVITIVLIVSVFSAHRDNIKRGLIDSGKDVTAVGCLFNTKDEMCIAFAREKFRK